MNLNKVFLLFLSVSFFIVSSAFSQGGTWTWRSGDSAANSSGVFGTQGVPSVNNHPPALYEPCDWKDMQGNFWLYGGVGSLSSFSDLWKYNPGTNEWTWVKGSGGANVVPVYGIKGIANSSNTPGGRGYGIASCVDTAGNLWLFGGYGNSGPMNDLWEYNISTNNWAWISGNGVNATGVHGKQGVPSSSNQPGARHESCSSWTDSLNNLWLFGGFGYDDNETLGFLNDLCKYDIATNEWTWMKGSALVNASSNYGIKGVSNSNNDPGARDTYTKWKDIEGNFWLMGGLSNNDTALNDVWKYELSINEWTWMYGSNVPGDTGSYQQTCLFDPLNIPYSRMEQRSSVTDNCGRFWLFGGVLNVGGYFINDLWAFDPQLLKWEWLSGTNVINQLGNYGTLGVSSPSNVPPSRRGALAWWGNDNKFYLFGGLLVTNLGYDFSDLWVFNPDTNCISSSCAAVVVVPPVANFQSSQTIICANDCVNFTDLSPFATLWQWSFAGGAPSSSTDQNPQVCYSTQGIYNVTLVASNTGGSDTLTFNNYITVKAAPAQPNIKQHHDTLDCSTDLSYSSYQWSYDSIAITGATDTLLIISKSGNYNIEVTNENGCKIAVGINVVLGLQNYVNDNFISLSPNPATDELLISGNWQATGRLTIFNVLGETIYSNAINRKQETINCKPFPAGIYFVQIITEKARWVGRFVKE